MKINKTTSVAVLLMMTIVMAPMPVFCEDTSTDMSMVIGDLQSVPVAKLERVSVTDPDVADVADAQADKVMILAKKAGRTGIFLWDNEGKHTVVVHVVSQDIKQMTDRINHLLKEAEIKTVKLEANSSEGKVILSGTIPKAKKGLFEKIISSYDEQIINLVKDELSQDLIQIDMQITELSATLNKNLGFDWSGGAIGGDLSLNYEEDAAPTGGSKNWFQLGQFNRTTRIANTVNLLIKEGKARDLSRPRVLVSSGKEATINVGGEVPISSITTSASGGEQTQNTTFKQYGITLSVTPTLKEEKIDIVMNLQVSDVDKTFALPATKTSDIAYKTRSTQTQLLLEDRQQVIFAGLIRYNDSDQIKRVPFLGSIPVVGLLFRNYSKQAPDEGKELIISLTPTIMRTKEYNQEQVKMPSRQAEDFVKEMDVKQATEYEKLPAIGGAQPAPAAVTPAPAEVPVSLMPTMTRSDSFSGANMGYVRSVQTKISQQIRYPYDAVKNNWQGTVKLKLHILKDGSLADVTVLESSGRDIFDQDAINAAKGSAPFDVFAADMKIDHLNVTLPIVYNQGGANNSQTVVATY